MSNKIFALIPKVMQDIGAIGKDRRNPQQGYAFRGIDDVYNAVQGPFARHGIFVAPKVLSQAREERQTAKGGTLIYTILTVQFTFYADDGSAVEVVTVGEAMDSGDKSANKAMSAAMKYAMLQVFCIPTDEDNDTENWSPEPDSRPNQNQSRQISKPPTSEEIFRGEPRQDVGPDLCNQGHKMMISKRNPNEFYCMTCKVSKPRAGAA
jgi:hypothetical protein